MWLLLQLSFIWCHGSALDILGGWVTILPPLVVGNYFNPATLECCLGLGEHFNSKHMWDQYFQPMTQPHKRKFQYKKNKRRKQQNMILIKEQQLPMVGSGKGKPRDSKEISKAGRLRKGYARRNSYKEKIYKSLEMKISKSNKKTQTHCREYNWNKDTRGQLKGWARKNILLYLEIMKTISLIQF